MKLSSSRCCQAEYSSRGQQQLPSFVRGTAELGRPGSSQAPAGFSAGVGLCTSTLRWFIRVIITTEELRTIFKSLVKLNSYGY